MFASSIYRLISAGFAGKRWWWITISVVGVIHSGQGETLTHLELAREIFHGPFATLRHVRHKVVTRGFRRASRLISSSRAASFEAGCMHGSGRSVSRSESEEKVGTGIDEASGRVRSSKAIMGWSIKRKKLVRSPTNRQAKKGFVLSVTVQAIKQKLHRVSVAYNRT